MEIQRNIDLDIKKLFTNSVGKNKDFHFYADELTSGNFMPTYTGMADEKYTFDEMNDDFFTFLDEKRRGDGIYIRLVFAQGFNTPNGARFLLEYSGEKCEFKTNDLDNVLVFEFADFGVKIQNDTVTFGTTVEGGCGMTPYFAEFGSERGNSEFLSLENPLNQCVLKIMDEILNQL